jgi:hypothetical protein
MGRMKNLYINMLEATAEANRKAYDDYFNSATNEEESALYVEVFDFEDEEYLDSEDDRGYYF